MRLTLPLALVALFSLSASAEWNDSVPTSGRPMEGEVQQVTYKEITIIVGGGGKIQVAMDQVKGEITWDNDSLVGAVGSGKSKFQAGQYAGAIIDLGKAIASGQTREVLKQELTFYLAESYRMTGDFAQASTTYQGILKKWPDTYYLSKIYTNIIDCFMFSNPPNLSGALTQITGAIGKAKELNLSEEFVGGLKLKEAKIYELQKAWPQATAAYQALTGSKTPRIQWAAYAGLGKCQLNANEIQKATASFQKVVDGCEPGNNGTLAIAYNGLGDIYWTAQNYKEASLCFIRTAVLYLPGSTDLTDDHARGMMMAIRCLQKLGKDATKPEDKERYGTEAARLKGRFQNEYSKDYDGYWQLINKEP